MLHVLLLLGQLLFDTQCEAGSPLILPPPSPCPSLPPPPPPPLPVSVLCPLPSPGRVSTLPYFTPQHLKGGDSATMAIVLASGRKCGCASYTTPTRQPFCWESVFLDTCAWSELECHMEWSDLK